MLQKRGGTAENGFDLIYELQVNGVLKKNAVFISHKLMLILQRIIDIVNFCFYLFLKSLKYPDAIIDMFSLNPELDLAILV